MFAFANRYDTQRKNKSPDGRRHQQSRAASRTRLRFEPLEERRLLSVITVNDLGDTVGVAGKVTLRDAILTANDTNGNDTIQFATGLNGTITLTAGELAITDGLTINGPGSTKLTINAAGHSRIFNITDSDTASNFNVTINGLTLTGGHSTANGGAILSGENLILKNSTVSGNSSDAKGGGIWIQPSDHGDTTIQNCTISSNHATGNGGGIGVFTYLNTDTLIQDSTISGNSADGHGGGLYLDTSDTGSTTTVRASTISGNHAINDGGGIWAQSYNHATLSVLGSTISGDNQAGGAGGGIYADTSYNSSATIQDSAITGNKATGSGGGIYTDTSYNATTNIQNVAISANESGVDGGGIWTRSTNDGETTIQTSSITGLNKAARDGGGIWLRSYGGDTNIQFTTVAGNAAVTGAGIEAFTDTDNTGASPLAGTTIIQNSTVSGNGDATTTDGGGIWLENDYSGTTTIRNSTVSGNIAHQYGGGLYSRNYGAVAIQNSTITGNSTDQGGGGIYSYYDYTGSSTHSLTISSTIIAVNTDVSDAAPDIFDLSGAMVLDHSLVGDNTGSGLTAGNPDGSGNLIGSSGAAIVPLLGALANNGGLTKTCALQAGSPAIDMGAANGLTTDQRGFGYPRVGGTLAVADIGAYEIATPTATPPQIAVLNSATVIPNGQTTPINIGTGLKDAIGPNKTFTIRNDGQQTLILTMPLASTTHFTVGQPVTGALAAGATTTFTVTLKTGAVWTGSEVISIGSDGVASLFTFTVSGVVVALHDASTPGVYDPAISRYYLRNSNSSGNANITFAYGAAGAGWIPIVGDWDGNGTVTAGIYDPVASRFYLRNTNTSGNANVVFVYGPGGAGWKPIVGDWNGDGIDTIGLYDPAVSRFYLRNTNSGGNATIVFAYGAAGAGWTPLAGDWNGDGTDTIGVYVPETSRFYLRNSNTSGNANISAAYGAAGAGWKPLTGDWNSDGIDTIGVYVPSISRFYLRNSNTPGNAQIAFAYGAPGAGWTPLVGDWNGFTSPLLAADGPVVAAADAAPLTMSQLQPLLTEAIARWTAAGLSDSAVSLLKGVNVQITDLPGSLLGEAIGNTIYIDSNAAGYGWFVDATPASSEEFAASGIDQQLKAVDPRAVDRIDLLTVVEHELGHVVGLGDLDVLATDLMSGVLGVGARRGPSHQDAVDAILAL
jgi:hypothetical protein